MISVIISKENFKDNYIIVDDKTDINHLKNAFRVKIGEEIRAVDGEKEYICQIKEIDKKEIVLEIIKVYDDRYSLNVEIDAGIGLLKNDKMDLTIQKLTELGINKIIPLSTKRAVVKISEKKDKWDLIVKESLKQCQGVKPLVIDEIKKIENIDLKYYDLIIVPYENEECRSIKDIFSSLDRSSIKKVLYIIGSEGGFESSEIEYLKENGANIVTLGKRILRAETASIVVGGILVNELQ